MLRTRWKRREKVKDKRFAASLLNGMRRFLVVLGDYWKRRTTPPGAEQDETYTDQW